MVMGEAATATLACTAAWAWDPVWATTACRTTTMGLLSTTAALMATQELLTTLIMADRPSTMAGLTEVDLVDPLRPTWAVAHLDLADRTVTRGTRLSTCRLTWPARPCRTLSALRSAHPLPRARAALNTTSRRPTTPTSVRAGV